MRPIHAINHSLLKKCRYIVPSDLCLQHYLVISVVKRGLTRVILQNELKIKLIEELRYSHKTKSIHGQDQMKAKGVGFESFEGFEGVLDS